MKKFFKSLVGCIHEMLNGKTEIQITENSPGPIKNVDYSTVRRIFRTLRVLPKGGSFPIKKELVYAVRKIANDNFPEYKIRIVNFGTSYRVFRRA
jgi:hypothetical protein